MNLPRPLRRMLDRLWSSSAPSIGPEAAIQRSFDAATVGRRRLPTLPANTLRMPGPRQLRDAARHAGANNPIIAALVTRLVTALIGTGFTVTPTHPDPGIREMLSREFLDWTYRADVTARCDLEALCALMARHVVVDGEIFIRLITDADGLRLQLIDADQVDISYSAHLGEGRIIRAGIEFDANGRRLAYHVFKDRDGLGLGLARLRIPAADMIHLFKPIVSGQVRGLTWLAPVLLRASDVDAARDAQLVKTKMASMLTGFIIKPAGAGFGIAPVSDSPDAAPPLPSLEPGAMRDLAPGEDVRFSEPPPIGADVISFMKLSVQDIAAAYGMPAFLLTGDTAEVNLSSARVVLAEFRKVIEADQHGVFVFQALRPIWRRFVQTEVMAGRIDIPDFFKAPESALGARFIPPRIEWYDPVKDVSAERLAIRAGLTSRRAAVAARGLNIEDLDDEIAADKARETALGLDFEDTARKPNAA